MALAAGIAAADLLAGETVNLIGVLALPPLIAAPIIDARRTAVVSVFCVALAVAAGAWNGVFGELNPHLIRLLTVAVAGVFATWLAHLRISLIEARRRSAALAQAGLLLENTLDPRSLVERTARLAVPLLADVAAVELVDERGGIRRMAAAGASMRLEQLMESQGSLSIDPEGPHPAARALRTGATQMVPVMTDAVRQEMAQDGRHLDFLDKLGLRWGVCVPLRARGKSLGVLTLGSVTNPRHDPEDIRAAEELARRAALALDAARMHRSQVVTSRTLQEGILPDHLERVPGVRSAGTIAAGGAEIGGDVYDVFASGDSRWAAAIADVCGKGPRAASLASLVRYTLRANALRDPAPSEALRLLNSAMLRQGVDGRFCTVAYAVLETTDAGIHATISRGGHPPVMVLRSDGAVETVGPAGTLLGVLPDPRLSDEEVDLGPGDSLVFYTDGLIEAGRDNALGIARVESLLGKSWGLRPEEIADRLVREAETFEKQGPRDDVAILVLQLDGGFRQPGFHRVRTGAEPVFHRA
jgi:serine phosphatase RsbU (regulator of sigma subunit)